MQCFWWSFLGSLFFRMVSIPIRCKLVNHGDFVLFWMVFNYAMVFDGVLVWNGMLFWSSGDFNHVHGCLLICGFTMVSDWFSSRFTFFWGN